MTCSSHSESTLFTEAPRHCVSGDPQDRVAACDFPANQLTLCKMGISQGASRLLSPNPVHTEITADSGKAEAVWSLNNRPLIPCTAAQLLCDTGHVTDVPVSCTRQHKEWTKGHIRTCMVLLCEAPRNQERGTTLRDIFGFGRPYHPHLGV